MIKRNNGYVYKDIKGIWDTEEYFGILGNTCLPKSRDIFQNNRRDTGY